MDPTQSFDVFCEASWSRLVTGLTHQLGDAQLAEDAAQEALIRAGVRWREVRRASSPIAWTFRVGSNLAMSEFRRRSRERRAVSRLAASEADEGMSTVEHADVLQRALARLTEQQRRVVIARFYLDLTVAEVAGEFRMSEGAVRAAAHRGIAQLRTELAPTINLSEE